MAFFCNMRFGDTPVFGITCAHPHILRYGKRCFIMSKNQYSNQTQDCSRTKQNARNEDSQMKSSNQKNSRSKRPSSEG